MDIVSPSLFNVSDAAGNATTQVARTVTMEATTPSAPSAPPSDSGATATSTTP